MHHDATPEQRGLQKLARHPGSEVFGPGELARDSGQAVITAEERKNLADSDLLGVCLPEEYGGSDRPLIDALIASSTNSARRRPSKCSRPMWGPHGSSTCSGPTARAVGTCDTDDLDPT